VTKVRPFFSFPALWTKKFDPSIPRDPMKSNYAQSGYIVEPIMQVYIAGPLFTTAEQQFNFALKDELRSIKPHWDFFLPQYEVIYRDGMSAQDLAKECMKGLIKSEILIAILDGSDVGSGTAFEIGFAYAQNIKIIGLRTDFRNCGDVEGFGMNAMFSLIPEIYHSRKELLDAINKLP